jgi:hypothetical protein
MSHSPAYVFFSNLVGSSSDPNFGHLTIGIIWHSAFHTVYTWYRSTYIPLLYLQSYILDLVFGVVVLTYYTIWTHTYRLMYNNTLITVYIYIRICISIYIQFTAVPHLPWHYLLSTSTGRLSSASRCCCRGPVTLDLQMVWTAPPSIAGCWY